MWRDFCANLTTHPIVRVMLEDPYTRDARLKPAGYAGDARTLDYVYLRDPGAQVVTATGRELFQASTGVPIADAVRGRALAVARQISQLASHGTAIAVASVACGHLRELDYVSPPLLRCVDVWGYDQDPISVEVCVSRHRENRVSAHVGAVRDLLVGYAKIPESSLVYASGLFDYLDDRAATALIKRIASSLRPGGIALAANLTPANEEIAYMEAIMDWWMHYRTMSDLTHLAAAAQLDPADVSVDVDESSGGRLAWLRVRRH